MSARLNNKIREKLLYLAIEEKFNTKQLIEEHNALNVKASSLVIDLLPKRIKSAIYLCKDYIDDSRSMSFNSKMITKYGYENIISEIYVDFNIERILSYDGVKKAILVVLSEEEFMYFMQNKWSVSYSDKYKEIITKIFGQELVDEIIDFALRYDTFYRERNIFKNKVNCTLSNINTFKQLEEQIPNLYALYIKDNLEKKSVTKNESICDKAEEINALLTKSESDGSKV